MNLKLLKNSLIYFVGTLIFSVFNYLFNAQMGQKLGPSEYSIIGSLLSLIVIITMPTNAVSTIIMRYAAHYNSQNQGGKIKAFALHLTKRMASVGILIAIIFALASGWIADFLKLPSTTPVIIISPILAFLFVLPINRGLLQGLQRFFDSVINQNIDPLIKLILGLSLVSLGYGVNGAMVAILIGTAIAYFGSFWPIRQLLREPSQPIAHLPTEAKEYSWTAFLAFIFATLLLQIDVILVKHFLDPHTAGLYTALSTMAKIVLFVTTPVVSVMFPMISDLRGRDQKHYLILMQSFLLVFAIGLISCLGFYWFAPTVVNILYKAEFISVAPYLGLFGVAMLLYSLTNLWVNYFLSIGNRFFIIALGLITILEIGLIWWRHDNFTVIINNLLLTNAMGFILLTGYYLYLKWPQILESWPSKLLPLHREP